MFGAVDEIPISLHTTPAEPIDQVLARYLRPGTLSLAALPPLSVYVHLPWCLQKCPYCDFNSHALSSSLPEAPYLAALRCDLEAALPLVWGRRIHSIFIGGGTPSLFSPDAIAELIADLRARLPLEPGCEITLEANPGTFERARFRAFRGAGVTRLSVGVQSFDDTKLAALGRVHSGAQARAAVQEAGESFDTFNLDLMYALPSQTLSELRADLDVALSLNPPHLSLYHLTLEPNTVFAKHPPAHLPDEDTAADMLDTLIERLDAHQLQRYEVSAFALPGHRCCHNLNYWQFGDYLGLGAGAHSKLSFPHRIVRQVRYRDPAKYMLQAMAGAAITQDHIVARHELPFEFMLNALRLKDGFELSRFAERTGLPLSAMDAPLREAVARGWLKSDSAWIVPTARGFDFLNDVVALFLPEGRAR
jgi:putative oxygen-independent coproporphyrinogen III oxidase